MCIRDSYYTVVAHNDVFSKAACLSSAVGFCYDAMREELTAAGPLLPDTRVYMSWGSKESGRKPGLVKYKMCIRDRIKTVRNVGYIMSDKEN